ncbi:MAG: KilA-N domain-containing protein [Clostridia bacterium]|nr:KilA-N domain-containing protein [Clostridia bacterium]
MKKEIIKTEIVVKDTSIRVIRVGNIDYISLTDLARFKDSERFDYIIQNWLRSKHTLEYVGTWELLYNPNFKATEFDGFKNEAGTHSFVMTPKRWITSTNAIGIISKQGRYNSGTFAHPDIAFEFASWISAEFKLYLVQEFERLKQNESYQNKINWSVRRELAKTNYKIHTDSIKENIIPSISENNKQYVYVNEADMLNVALFGMTAKEWKEKNPDLNGNMRDYANILQLVILSNLENLNAEMIEQGLEQRKRLERLNEIAKKQYSVLQDNKSIKKIESLDSKENLNLL